MAAIPSVINVVYNPHVNILVYNKEKKNKQIQKTYITYCELCSYTNSVYLNCIFKKYFILIFPVLTIPHIYTYLVNT